MGDVSQRKKKRNWNSEHYPKSIVVRVTEEEHQKITQRASVRRVSTSRYLVKCGLGKRLPKLKESWPVTEQEREQLEMLLRQLWKVGTNLNQLAHGYNLARYTGIKAPAQSEVETAAAAVRKLIGVIKVRL